MIYLLKVTNDIAKLSHEREEGFEVLTSTDNENIYLEFDALFQKLSDNVYRGDLNAMKVITKYIQIPPITLNKSICCMRIEILSKNIFYSVDIAKKIFDELLNSNLKIGITLADNIVNVYSVFDLKNMPSSIYENFSLKDYGILISFTISNEVLENLCNTSDIVKLLQTNGWIRHEVGNLKPPITGKIGSQLSNIYSKFSKIIDKK